MIHRCLIFFYVILFSCILYSQQGVEKIRKFNDIIVIKTTPVKSQYFTGTCWNFAAISFIEAELLRKKGKELNLSEKFVVRSNYIDKAKKYVSLNAGFDFQQGGQAHDALIAIENSGIVPEEVYPMDSNDDNTLLHFELSNALRGMLDGIIKNSNGNITRIHQKATINLIDAYLGAITDTFVYQGKKFTPKKYYNEEIGLDLDNYSELTSTEKQEFYKTINLKLTDNWREENYLNLPVDQLISVVDNSLKNGYSVVWDGDVTQDKYDVNRIIYRIETEDKPDRISINKYVKDKRQPFLDNNKTSDDHLMHIIGLSKDEDGNVYYKLKDSAGINHPFVYMSKAYFLLNTVALLINKDVLSSKQLKKIKKN